MSNANGTLTAWISCEEPDCTRCDVTGVALSLGECIRGGEGSTYSLVASSSLQTCSASLRSSTSKLTKGEVAGVVIGVVIVVALIAAVSL